MIRAEKMSEMSDVFSLYKNNKSCVQWILHDIVLAASDGKKKIVLTDTMSMEFKILQHNVNGVVDILENAGYKIAYDYDSQGACNSIIVSWKVK